MLINTKEKLLLCKRIFPYPFLLLLFFSQKTQAFQVDSINFNMSLGQFHKHKFANTDSAKYYLEKMDILSQNDLRSTYRYRYYVTSGGWGLVKREIPKAVESYKKALELANQLKNNEFIVKSKFNLGSAYGEMGDYHKAVTLFKEVESALDRVKGDYTLFSNQFRANMVQFYFTTKDIPTAFRYSDQMKSNLKSYDDSTMYYMSRLQLLNSAKRYTETVDLGEEALQKLRKSDLHFLYQTHALLGMANTELSNYKKAFKNLFKARDLSIKLGIESEVIENSLGLLYMKTRNYKNATIHFKRLIELSEKHAKQGSKISALENLAQIAKKEGNYAEALRFMEQYIILSDSLLGLEKIKAIQDAEARYELKDKEKTIEQQKEVNALQEALLKEGNQRRAVLIRFLFCSALLAAALWFFCRRTTRINRQLVVQRNQIESHAAELKSANVMRDKLFAIISHDLRSPISSLVQSLEQNESVKPLNNLMFALNNVQLILDNLLKWAQMQLSTRPFHFKEVYPVSQLNCVVNQFQPELNQKQIQVLTEYKYTGTVWADEESLLIILRNILSNAVKFTGENGLIRLTLDKKDGQVCLVVRDSGVGMNTEELEGLFVYPEPQSGTMGEKGTGLGMSLTKDLIVNMGGNIMVKSRPGVGTSVELTLPLSPDY